MEIRGYSQITEKKSFDLWRERDKLGAKQFIVPKRKESYATPYV
jgi:hypothetical protein